MSKSRVVLLYLSMEELRRVSMMGSGVVLKLVVTHANIAVSGEDDSGGGVEVRRSVLAGIPES